MARAHPTASRPPEALTQPKLISMSRHRPGVDVGTGLIGVDQVRLHPVMVQPLQRLVHPQVEPVSRSPMSMLVPAGMA
jgi:hypothetical protein